jgi:DnaJ-class molecular chaperone
MRNSAPYPRKKCPSCGGSGTQPSGIGLCFLCDGEGSLRMAPAEIPEPTASVPYRCLKCGRMTGGAVTCLCS